MRVLKLHGKEARLPGKETRAKTAATGALAILNLLDSAASAASPVSDAGDSNHRANIRESWN